MLFFKRKTPLYFEILGYGLSLIGHLSTLTLFLGCLYWREKSAPSFLEVKLLFEERPLKREIFSKKEMSLKTKQKNLHSSSLTKDFSKEIEKKPGGSSFVESFSPKEVLEERIPAKEPLKKNNLSSSDIFYEGPRLLNFEKIPYPQDAFREGHEGDVSLLLEIDERGRVLRAVIQKKSGWKSLDEAALKHSKKLIFMPAFKNGRPIAVSAEITFPFRLEYKEILDAR